MTTLILSTENYFKVCNYFSSSLHSCEFQVIKILPNLKNIKRIVYIGRLEHTDLMISLDIRNDLEIRSFAEICDMVKLLLFFAIQNPMLFLGSQ